MQVGMEFWAQWAHKALWHASLWHMHEVLSPSLAWFIFDKVSLDYLPIDTTESSSRSSCYIDFILVQFHVRSLITNQERAHLSWMTSLRSQTRSQPLPSSTTASSTRASFLASVLVRYVSLKALYFNKLSKALFLAPATVRNHRQNHPQNIPYQFNYKKKHIMPKKNFVNLWGHVCVGPSRNLMKCIEWTCRG